jgi:NADPH:quinone reductase-like Zn-dependent oxidoreductase
MAIPATQRVVLLREFGGPERLAVVEQAVPEPRAGEVYQTKGTRR